MFVCGCVCVFVHMCMRVCVSACVWVCVSVFTYFVFARCACVRPHVRVRVQFVLRTGCFATNARTYTKRLMILGEGQSPIRLFDLFGVHLASHWARAGARDSRSSDRCRLSEGQALGKNRLHLLVHAARVRQACRHRLQFRYPIISASFSSPQVHFVLPVTAGPPRRKASCVISPCFSLAAVLGQILNCRRVRCSLNSRGSFFTITTQFPCLKD